MFQQPEITPTPVPPPVVAPAAVPVPVPVSVSVPRRPEPAASTSTGGDNIFAEMTSGGSTKDLDVTAIITSRLNAMRKLQDNPLDSEALKLMYNTQKDVSYSSLWLRIDHDKNNYPKTAFSPTQL